jgi:hypothetical protein
MQSSGREFTRWARLVWSNLPVVQRSCQPETTAGPGASAAQGLVGARPPRSAGAMPKPARGQEETRNRSSYPAFRRGDGAERPAHRRGGDGGCEKPPKRYSPERCKPRQGQEDCAQWCADNPRDKPDIRVQGSTDALGNHQPDRCAECPGCGASERATRDEASRNDGNPDRTDLARCPDTWGFHEASGSEWPCTCCRHRRPPGGPHSWDEATTGHPPPVVAESPHNLHTRSEAPNGEGQPPWIL